MCLSRLALGGGGSVRRTAVAITAGEVEEESTQLMNLLRLSVQCRPTCVTHAVTHAASAAVGDLPRTLRTNRMSVLRHVVHPEPRPCLGARTASHMKVPIQLPKGLPSRLRSRRQTSASSSFNTKSLECGSDTARRNSGESHLFHLPLVVMTATLLNHLGSMQSPVRPGVGLGLAC